MSTPERVTDDNLPSLVDRFDDAIDAAWGRIFRGHPLADRVFYLASELGDFSVIWQIISAAQGLRSEEDADASIRFGLLLLAESAIVNQGIKRLVNRPRPVAVEPRPLHVRKPLTSSFPSGHSSSAAFAAVLLAKRWPKARIPLALLAATVATSRVHVQVHHASDVAAGLAVGVGLAKAAERVWPVPAR